LRTARILFKVRPEFLFVQNPSMVLAVLACVHGWMTRTFVVVDRHTTFRLNKPPSRAPRVVVFMTASRFTIKHADLTIVTNQQLAEIVQAHGGRPFILPDPLPVLRRSEEEPNAEAFSVLFISSYGEDEPLGEVLEGARSLVDEGVKIFITGNEKKADPELVAGAPPNVEFTGFLSDQEFVDRLFSSDAVMVLTTHDAVMLCGCYEAVSAGKPLITSKKTVLEEYFTGSVFVESDGESIADGIRSVKEDHPAAVQNSVRLRERLSLEDDGRLAELERVLGQR
jgi:glycosyltransferase involved in cell wall biosynthesis